jgi:hypothetical protein
MNIDSTRKAQLLKRFDLFAECLLEQKRWNLLSADNHGNTKKIGFTARQ